MTRTPQDNQRLRQLMDSCRPGSDDLSLPEMADLAMALRADAALRREWEISQRSDRVVVAAMYDVTVPVGLAERILAAASARDGERLAEATRAAAVIETKPNADGVQVAAKSALLGGRRRWLAWAGGVAIALVAAIAVWKMWGPPEEVSKDQLATSAQEWFTTALKRAGKLHGPSEATPVPFPHQAVTLKYQAWRWLDASQEPSLVTFDLTQTQLGGSVFLFAAKTTKKYDVRSVPFTRLAATGGLEMGAWQQDDVIYVLVVDTQQSGLHLDNVLRDPKLAYVSHGRR